MNTETNTATKAATSSTSNGAREYTIDAAGKRLGRLATEIASLLLGKNSPDVAKHVVAPVSVKVINAAKLDISDKKGAAEFQRYSGYPSGRHVETVIHLAKRRGYEEVIKRVVGGMLPKNKLQKLRLKNLEVAE